MSMQLSRSIFAQMDADGGASITGDTATGSRTKGADDGKPKLWQCTHRIPEGVGAGTRLPKFVLSGPDVIQGRFQSNNHTNNKYGFTELDKQYHQSVSSIPNSSDAGYLSSQFQKQGSLYRSYSSSRYITGNLSLSHSSSQATLNEDYYSSYEYPEFEKRCKIHNNVNCLYQINEEFVLKCVKSMMELIKQSENNVKEKLFDDTDGYRLPNLSMYKCVDKYLCSIVEMLRNPHQRAE